MIIMKGHVTMKSFLKTCLTIYGGYCLLKNLSKKICITVKIEKPDKEKIG